MLNKRLCVLGEVNKRFVVSPNVEALLSAMDLADRNDMEEAEKDPAIMDST
jgi:DNA-directed RNA polymerase III subunit RPC4